MEGSLRPDSAAVIGAPEFLTEIYKSCWDQDPKARPTMLKIKNLVEAPEAKPNSSNLRTLTRWNEVKELEALSYTPPIWQKNCKPNIL